MRALENTLTPEKICNDFFNGSMSKNEAEALLISLVETSEDMNIRIECIDAFEQIRIKNERIFEILEICLISDENPLIRAAAAKSFLLLFPKKGLHPLRWAIQNEKSAFVNIPLFDLLETLDNPDLEIYSTEIIKRFEVLATKYIDDNIHPQDALIMGLVELLTGRKVSSNEIMDISGEIEHFMFHYKISEDGRRIRIKNFVGELIESYNLNGKSELKFNTYRIYNRN